MITLDYYGDEWPGAMVSLPHTVEDAMYAMGFDAPRYPVPAIPLTIEWCNIPRWNVDHVILWEGFAKEPENMRAIYMDNHKSEWKSELY